MNDLKLEHNIKCVSVLQNWEKKGAYKQKNSVQAYCTFILPGSQLNRALNAAYISSFDALLHCFFSKVGSVWHHPSRAITLLLLLLLLLWFLQNRLVLSLPWPRPLNTFRSLVSFQPQSCNLLCSFSSGFLLNWREKAMKKSAFEKMVLQKNRSKGSQEDQKRRSNRFLVTVNILGSAGPIRFVVNEKDLVSGVIGTALKSYAREGRLPVLGFDVSNFLLYCANAGFDGMVAYPFGIFWCMKLHPFYGQCAC